jgi:hypothetical protein
MEEIQLKGTRPKIVQHRSLRGMADSRVNASNSDCGTVGHGVVSSAHEVFIISRHQPADLEHSRNMELTTGWWELKSGCEKNYWGGIAMEI